MCKLTNSDWTFGTRPANPVGKGGASHCGRCGTCVERQEAFHRAGVADPTVYADRDFWIEEVRKRKLET